MPSRLMMGVILALFAAPGCKSPMFVPSEPKIINGKELKSDEFPAVVPIDRVTSAGDIELASQACTGTFIATRVVITAAHCITDLISADGTVKTPGVERIFGEIPTKILVHPDYQGTGFDPLHDVALMVFGRDLAPGVALISSRPAVMDDTIEIVGFGRHTPSDGDSAGVKRWGINKLASAGETLIFRGLATNEDSDGEDTASSKGDSGGPMFLAGALIGTTVGGAIDDNRKISEYTHLYTSKIKSFLMEASAQGIGFDLPDSFKN